MYWILIIAHAIQDIAIQSYDFKLPRPLGRGLILIIIAILIHFQLQAQMTMYQTDSLTYQQYLEKDYKALIETGKSALEQGKDFYYLRMRMGIAYYEQQNYEAALPHFQKAAEMNPQDAVLQEYLYYSYLFAGRQAESELLAEKFRSDLQEKVQYQRRFIRNLSIGGGGIITNNIQKKQDISLLDGSHAFASANYRGNIYYGNISLETAINTRFHLTLSGAVYNTNSLSVIQTPFNSFKTESSNTHGQANVIGKYQFNKGWALSVGFGYYKINGSYTYLSLPDSGGLPQLNTVKVPTHSFLGVMNVSKRFKYGQFDISASASNLSDTSQVQTEAALTYYPLGNTRFYGKTSAAYLYNGGQHQYVFSQYIGGQIASFLWAEAKGSYGNHQNYATNNGVLAYNTFDPIRWTAGADLRFCFKRFEWRVGYEYQARQGSNILYTTPANTTDYQVTKYNYSNHLIKTQLIWKF